MKPSEVRDYSYEPYAYIPDSRGGKYYYKDLVTEYRSRTPMKYKPKQFIQIGPWNQLLNRSYTAELRYQRWPAMKRTSHFFNVDGSLKYSAEAVDIRKTHQALTPPVWVMLMEANAENQLIVEFLNKIQTRKVSILEESKNFKETITTIAKSAERMVRYARQMFRNPVRWLAKADMYNDFRGGRRTGHQAIKSYGDLWLEGRYHWLPTYMTMRDAFIALQDLIPGMQVFKKGPGARGEYKLAEKHAWYLNPGVIWDVEFSFQHKMSCFITAESEAAAIARRYGVGGFADLTAVIWETTPWTLVLDWVVPVSEVLLAHNALSGLKTHNPCQVRKWKKSGTSFGTPVKGNQGSICRKIQDGEIWLETYQRTTESVTSLSPNLFIADEVINIKRVIDSLSFFSGSKMGKKIISGKI